MARLIAYVDESEGQVGDRWFVLAGYVHSEADWKSFNEEWASTLRASPAIGGFHMADAWTFAGEFAGWRLDDRDRKLTALAAVIERHAPRAVGVVVSQRDWDELVGPVGPYELRQPYFAAYYAWVVNAARIELGLGNNGPIDYCFDEKGTLGTFTAMWHKEVMKSQSNELQGCIGETRFSDDHVCLPLQAADLLAWHARRRREGKLNAERQSLFKSAWGQQYGEVDIDRAQITKWAADFARVPGIEYVREKGGATRRRRGLQERLAMDLGPPIPIERLQNPIYYHFLKLRIFLRSILWKAYWRLVRRDRKRPS